MPLRLYDRFLDIFNIGSIFFIFLCNFILFWEQVIFLYHCLLMNVTAAWTSVLNIVTFCLTSLYLGIYLSEKINITNYHDVLHDLHFNLQLFIHLYFSMYFTHTFILLTHTHTLSLSLSLIYIYTHAWRFWLKYQGKILFSS